MGSRSLLTLRRTALVLGIATALACATYVFGYLTSLRNYYGSPEYSMLGEMNVQPTLGNFHLGPYDWAYAVVSGLGILVGIMGTIGVTIVALQPLGRRVCHALNKKSA